MDNVYNWGVFDTQYRELTTFKSYEDALKEYETVKDDILVAGEIIDENYEVYIFELKKKAFLIKDENNKVDPEVYDFDYFLKWQEEDI